MLVIKNRNIKEPAKRLPEVRIIDPGIREKQGRCASLKVSERSLLSSFRSLDIRRRMLDIGKEIPEGLAVPK